jgi:hypothetical protein
MERIGDTEMLSVGMQGAQCDHRAERARTSTARYVPRAALVPLAAVAWWVFGYLPWLVGGMSGSSSVSVRAGGPGVGGARLVVPLTSSLTWPLVFGALVGGVVAGMLGLLARPGHRRRTTMATLIGVGLAVTVAVGQAVVAATGGLLNELSSGPRVLAGLCVVVAFMALVGWALGACATLGRPGAGIALAVLAEVTPQWLPGVLTQMFGTSPIGPLGTRGTIMVWLSSMMLAIALAVIGVRPLSRLIWWPVALFVAWTVTPVLTSVAYLEPQIGPGTGFFRFLSDTIHETVQVLNSSAALGVKPLAPWVVAITIGTCLAFTVPRLTARTTLPVP